MRKIFAIVVMVFLLLGLCASQLPKVSVSGSYVQTFRIWQSSGVWANGWINFTKDGVVVGGPFAVMCNSNHTDYSFEVAEKPNDFSWHLWVQWSDSGEDWNGTNQPWPAVYTKTHGSEQVGLTANAQTTYTDVLLDNVDPNNHVYAHLGGGSSSAHGQVTVSPTYVISGQLKVRVLRHTDNNNAPNPSPRIGEDCPIQMGPPIVVPTQIYENDDAHKVHLWVWCSDGAGGTQVSDGGGWGYVSLTFQGPTGTVTVNNSVLSWSSGAVQAGWGGWWFRYNTQWFEFTFSGIVVLSDITVDLYLGVANHADGEYGLDGLVDVVVGWPWTPPSSPSVGGILLSVDKLRLLAPYIGLASTILVATVTTAVYVKRRKEKQ